MERCNLAIMAIRTVVDQKGVYFITFTCHNWLPLLDLANAYESVYTFFDVIKGKRHSVVGYVIMPKPIHLLLHYVPGGSTLNTIMGNGKRFIAYELVKRLEARKHTALLIQLAAAVEAKDRSRGKKHEV